MAMSMSSLEARSFEVFSSQNYESVKESLACGCEPYVDVFTLKRWNAQGYKVMKGEKAIRLITIIKKEEKDKETKKKEVKSFPKPVFVFCKCQVEKNDIKQ